MKHSHINKRISIFMTYQLDTTKLNLSENLAC